jgi:hypothetical protein
METVEQRIQIVLGSMLFQSIIKDQKIADLEKALEMAKIDKVEQTTETQPNK